MACQSVKGSSKRDKKDEFRTHSYKLDIYATTPTKTVKRLYEKIRHCRQATFYTDDWDAFSKVLPKNRHVIGKAHTVAIERNNSNTRYYLGRFNRKTKIVSRSEVMVNVTLKIWWYLCEKGHLTDLIHKFQSYLN